MLALPAEEYDWFDIQKGSQGRALGSKSAEPVLAADGAAEGENVADAARVQKQFFEYAGPLFGVRVSPQSSVVPVGKIRTYAPEQLLERMIELSLYTEENLK